MSSPIAGMVIDGDTGRLGFSGVHREISPLHEEFERGRMLGELCHADAWTD